MIGNKAEVELIPPIHIGYWYIVRVSGWVIARPWVIIIIPIQPNPHTWNALGLIERKGGLILNSAGNSHPYVIDRLARCSHYTLRTRFFLGKPIYLNRCPGIGCVGYQEIALNYISISYGYINGDDSMLHQTLFVRVRTSRFKGVYQKEPKMPIVWQIDCKVFLNLLRFNLSMSGDFGYRLIVLG